MVTQMLWTERLPFFMYISRTNQTAAILTKLVLQGSYGGMGDSKSYSR